MSAPQVSFFPGPPNEAWCSIYENDADGNPIYIGLAKSVQPVAVLAYTGVSKAAAAVVTSTAHGLTSGMRVTISGGTGAWAALNGTHIVTVTGADTFSVPVNSAAFADSFAGTITTHAPRTNAPCWAVEKREYTANALIMSRWAEGSSSPRVAWSDRASLAYE